ncbi:unnamed protein product [Symbiodinium necroappetens]|uniref:Uncharacterized protein n=1 Tax=Symbiodinium necroappetens TaxID=1628268 RepID=A0A813A156_9DINO|nr:unnamed protein product [Symbiodinium necroappetens]
MVISSSTALSGVLSACSPPVAFATDASFVFTDDGLQSVPRTPSYNVYVYLPHRMLDPVADDVKERVHRFWKTTYWGNADAFEVFMASFTLALRGEG